MKRIDGEWRYFDEALNMPYPWYTRPALEFLEKRILTRKRVFEYGTGDSTKWYRERGAVVYGVDNNRDYLSEGVQFKTTESEYTKAIFSHSLPFDIVVIDGEWRDECTQYALENLKDGGLLIIDNYMQPTVPTVWIKTQVFTEGMDAKIYKEPGHQDWQTLIVRK